MTTMETVSGTVLRPVAKTRWRRLILAQTAIDFWGRRWLWLGISALLIVAQRRLVHRQGPRARHRLRGRRVVGRAGRPASPSTTPATCSSDNGISVEGAKIQERNSDSGDIIKVQVGDQPQDVRVKLQEAFADGRRRASRPTSAWRR